MYKIDLLDPMISFQQLARKYPPPVKLYKYLYFGKYENGVFVENPHWKSGVKGIFHLSHAKTFDDKNDCEPYVNEHKFTEYIKKVCNAFEVKFSNEVMCELKKMDYNKLISELKEKFQSVPRIGCLTDTYLNNEMWECYSANHTGFCIEYITGSNMLLRNLTNKVVYTNERHDVSLSVALNMILSSVDYDEKFNIYYLMLQKNTYTCLYIKKPKWSFENEFRVIMPDHISSKEGELSAKEYIVSEPDNIDLSKAISAIYIGTNYKSVPNFKEKVSFINEITQKENIEVHFM